VERIKNKGQKKVIILSLISVMCYALLGCNNLMDAPKAAAPVEPGYGTVAVALTDSLARTVFPGTVFDNHVYTFTRTDSGDMPSEEIEPVNGVYTLPAGGWKLAVSVYKGAVVNDTNKLAEGEKTFTLADGAQETVMVPLALVKTGGAGKFSYVIQYPEAAEATITLVSLADPPPDDDSYDPNITLEPLASEPDGGNRISSQRDLDLDAGFYLVSVQLALGTMNAGKNEVALIYDKLTSEFGTEGAPIVFAIEDFAFPSTPETPVPTVNAILNGWISVTWAQDPLAEAYEVWYCPSADSPTLQKWGDDVTTTGTNITGLEIGTAYDVVVKAKNRLGATESLPASATPFITNLYVGNNPTPIDLYPVTGATPLAKAFNWIAANAEQDTNYTISLGADETQGAKTLNAASVNSKTGVTITLRGDNQERTIQLSGTGSLYTVASANVTLVLGDNITLRGVTANAASLVRVNSSGSLIMENGSKITGNKYTVNNGSIGGGVYLVTGYFTMNGGEISDNTVITNGAGVYANSNSAIIMNGGKISGNSSTSGATGNGAGVYISQSSFVMNGGEISGNSTLQGGGVYMSGRPGTSFVMNGGEISGNSAAVQAGGVYQYGFGVETSSFVMNGGEISGNSTAGNGGGVYLYGFNGKVSFTMNGGEISGNSAAAQGGGVFIRDNADTFFTMTGGEIFGNSATTNGGGVFIGSAAFFKKQPAEGSAESKSGVIYGYDVSDPKSNKVGDGSATDKGHAVYKSVDQRRETTVGETQHLDSAQTGADGGWTE
jgi:hypothetical protein